MEWSASAGLRVLSTGALRQEILPAPIHAPRFPCKEQNRRTMIQWARSSLCNKPCPALDIRICRARPQCPSRCIWKLRRRASGMAELRTRRLKYVLQKFSAHSPRRSKWSRPEDQNIVATQRTSVHVFVFDARNRGGRQPSDVFATRFFFIRFFSRERPAPL